MIWTLTIKLRDATLRQFVIQRAVTRAVADWAGALGIAEKTLHHMFHRETEVTFGRWRQHARLFMVLEQLAHGEKIVDVALGHGYTSQSAFAAMFKRHFGVAPSAFYS